MTIDSENMPGPVHSARQRAIVPGPSPQPAAAEPARAFLSALAAIGALLGALAASSCCLLPLALFGLGVSGAWIGNLTRLAPYQPYILFASAVGLGGGCWRAWSSRRAACAEGGSCPLPGRALLASLTLTTILVVAALAFDVLGPLFLGS